MGIAPVDFACPAPPTAQRLADQGYVFSESDDGGAGFVSPPGQTRAA